MESFKGHAFKVVILLGVVSLFADITYEGARSITGPFFAFLGASGAAVGITVGVAELVGYTLRLLSGYITDKTRQYWTLTIAGYAINLVAVPLLALANRWQVAALLLVAERLGKAIRVPPRDAILSYVTKEIGRGWGFGIHEALDQIGAVLGPLIMVGALFFRESYRHAFALLAIPAFLALVFLLIAQRAYPQPQEVQKENVLQVRGWKRTYWLYLLAVGLVAAGYINFALIAFHWSKDVVPSEYWIPALYAVAMAVDGVAALVVGRLFDVKGLKVLAVVTAISACFAPLVLFGGFWGATAGMILWGIGLGSQESIMRASVAELVPADKRGSAYGVISFVFGIASGVGSLLLGVLYDLGIVYVMIFSLLTQWAAVPIFLAIGVKPARES